MNDLYHRGEVTLPCVKISTDGGCCGSCAKIRTCDNRQCTSGLHETLYVNLRFPKGDK